VASRPYRLPLAPEYTLGRRFQYALLSLGDPNLYHVDEAQGFVEFPSQQEYVDLVDKALGLIEELYAPKGCGDPCALASSGPRLYGNDYNPLRRSFQGLLNLNTCRCGRRGGKGFAWAELGCCYARRVVELGAPLGGRSEDLPQLARATLFVKGNVRSTGLPRLDRVVGEAPADLVGSVILGGLLSFLGAGVFSGGREAKRVEYYLIPLAAVEEFAELRRIAGGPAGGGLAREVTGIARGLGASIEQAFLLAVNSRLAEAVELSAQASWRPEELAYSASILMVEPQQRPQVVEGFPLSTSLYRAYTPETLRTLSHLALAPPEGSRGALTACVVGAILLAENPCVADHLLGCLRDLHSLASSLRQAGDARAARGLERLAGLLRRDAQRLMERCTLGWRVGL
jgi:hypothetical protein